MAETASIPPEVVAVTDAENAFSNKLGRCGINQADHTKMRAVFRMAFGRAFAIGASRDLELLTRRYVGREVIAATPTQWAAKESANAAFRQAFGASFSVELGGDLEELTERYVGNEVLAAMPSQWAPEDWRWFWEQSLEAIREGFYAGLSQKELAAQAKRQAPRTEPNVAVGATRLLTEEVLTTGPGEATAPPFEAPPQSSSHADGILQQLRQTAGATMSDLALDEPAAHAEFCAWLQGSGIGIVLDTFHQNPQPEAVTEAVTGCMRIYDCVTMRVSDNGTIRIALRNAIEAYVNQMLATHQAGAVPVRQAAPRQQGLAGQYATATTPPASSQPQAQPRRPAPGEWKLTGTSIVIGQAASAPLTPATPERTRVNARGVVEALPSYENFVRGHRPKREPGMNAWLQDVVEVHAATCASGGISAEAAVARCIAGLNEQFAANFEARTGSYMDLRQEVAVALQAYFKSLANPA